MNVIFFHGKLSNPETSTTGKAIKECFEAAGHKVYIPDYKPNDNTLEEISKYLKQYVRDIVSVEEETVFIGISLGGFWALKMANKTPYCSCILLNPSLNYYGFTESPKDGLPLSIILNADDEILDSESTAKHFEGRAKVDLFQTGGHRMSNIYDIMPIILDNATQTDC
jgi:predicted esterase YcpF (UPF0227 family)